MKKQTKQGFSLSTIKRITLFGICGILLLSIRVNGQSVDQIRNSYSGNTTWDAATSTLKFTSNGTINQNQNSWKIPSNVKKVVIGKNVRVVGRFDWDHSGNVSIEGEDKKTSILYGTNQQGYAKKNGGGDKLSGVRATDGDVTLKNFTLLDSKGFGFTHRGGGFLSVINCQIIDERGGHGNNSDGIVCWGGGLIKDCYIETGDDNIKVYGDVTVENTECHMVDNSVPVQLGWGNYGSGAKGTFKNFKVTGTKGRVASGNGVINARTGTYNKTLIFDGITIDNPNASLFGFRDAKGTFNITMTDVDIKVKEFAKYFNNGISGTIKICGTTYGKGTTKNTFKCGDGANSGGGTTDPETDPVDPNPETGITDITDLTITSTTCTEVKLSWSDVNGETAYRIRRKTNGQSTFTTLGDVNANVTSYTDNSVAANTSYIYQVRPMVNNAAVKVSNNPTANVPTCEIDTDGDGTPDSQDGCKNDPNKIAPGECGCGTPEGICGSTEPTDITDLEVTNITCEQVKIAWSDVNGETAYRIRRKTNGQSTFTTLGDVNANVTSYTDNSVAANTSYIYQVRPMVNNAAVKVSNNPTANVPTCDDNGNGGGGDCDVWSGDGPWNGKGRIAISSDGNEHDKDDWAATPFSLALLASKGLQDQLTLYTYSDHIWGSNHDHSDARAQMKESAVEGGKRFGFDNTTFMEAVANPNAAYNALAEEINKSSANNPLFIIAAGPMQVVGEGINRSQVTKRQYVTVISHSAWNDNHSDRPSNWENHSGWTWNEMKNSFSGNGVTFTHIVDQNGGSGYDGMRADKSKFDWLKTHSAQNNPLYEDGSWNWLYSRQVAAQKGSDFDPSDAGMIIYLLTGKEKTDPIDAKNLMVSPIASCPSSTQAARVLGIEEDISAISLYPNPATDVLNFKGLNSNALIQIVDMNGSVLIESTSSSIDISGLSTGLYFAKVGVSTFKFNKQ